MSERLKKDLLILEEAHENGWGIWGFSALKNKKSTEYSLVTNKLLDKEWTDHREHLIGLKRKDDITTITVDDEQIDLDIAQFYYLKVLLDIYYMDEDAKDGGGYKIMEIKT